MKLIGQLETFQLMMVAIAQGLVPQTDVFLRQMLSADIVH
jgi:hypothetical protein